MTNKLAACSLVVSIACSFGCSTVPAKGSISDARLLEVAISSIDDASPACSVADDSTEDAAVKAMLKSRRFEVMEVTRETDEDGDLRQFLLLGEAGKRIVAIVYFDGSACSRYSFGLLPNE